MILPMNLNKTTKNHSHETSLFNCRLNNSIKLCYLAITFDIIPFFYKSSFATRVIDILAILSTV